METSLIGEMDMLREMGVRPSFPEMARRYGMGRHAAAKCLCRSYEIEAIKIISFCIHILA